MSIILQLATVPRVTWSMSGVGYTAWLGLNTMHRSWKEWRLVNPLDVLVDDVTRLIQIAKVLKTAFIGGGWGNVSIPKTMYVDEMTEIPRYSRTGCPVGCTLPVVYRLNQIRKY